ncbi:MAG: phage holin family protein [Candidatus Staskawiczbacteria bacterium]|nr:phage holin family protein [Candidatus Staskawiczbacteria bacterium]
MDTILIILINLVIIAAAVAVSAYIIPGVSVAGFLSALLVALVLGLFNASIRPLLILFTLPINILTFGLFTIIINASLILLASAIVPGFKVSGFWTALLFSIVLAIVLYIINVFVQP